MVFTTPTSESGQAMADKYKPKGFANGGTPQKGSLFIAGEAGAELVGDLGNGGTSVVNKNKCKN